MVVAAGEYSMLKFSRRAAPFVPAPTLTSTQEKSLPSQPEGLLAEACLALQFNCCHI